MIRPAGPRMSVQGLVRGLRSFYPFATQTPRLMRQGVIGMRSFHCTSGSSLRSSLPQGSWKYATRWWRTCSSTSSRGSTIMNEKRVDWHKRWETDDVVFHLGEVHRYLAKFADRLVDSKSGQHVLVPFAGKSFDVMWLLEQGHSVVAVEYVEKAVLDFFTENKLEARKSEVSVDGKNLVCYKTSDNRLHFYVANFFDITPAVCGQVDCVYDRGALVAVFPPEREQYVSTVLSLLSPSGRYLVITVDFKAEEYKQGPRSVPDDVLEALFGSNMNIERLACSDERRQALARGYGEKTYFFEKAHIMTWREK